MQLGADRVRRWTRRLILHCAACSGVSTRLRHFSLDESARGMRNLDGSCRAELNHCKVQVASAVKPDLFVTREVAFVARRTFAVCF
jgi:nucleoside-diphosphate-sugar epimerase